MTRGKGQNCGNQIMGHQAIIITQSSDSKHLSDYQCDNVIEEL